MTQPRNESLHGAIRRVALGMVLDLRTATVARVESYDAATRRAKVQPLVQEQIEVDGELQAIALPPISGVPVAFPGSSRGGTSFPLAPGDTVLLVFSDRSLDLWLARGGGPIDPVDLRHHHLQDAVAIPWWDPHGAGGPTDHTLIGQPGQAAQGVGLGANLRTELDNLWHQLEIHTHAVATTGTATAQSGTAAAPTITESKQTVESASVKTTS